MSTNSTSTTSRNSRISGYQTPTVSNPTTLVYNTQSLQPTVQPLYQPSYIIPTASNSNAAPGVTYITQPSYVPSQINAGAIPSMNNVAPCMYMYINKYSKNRNVRHVIYIQLHYQARPIQSMLI